MTPSTEPELDTLVTKLIVESGCAGTPAGAVPNWTLMGAGLPAEVATARDALLTHITTKYVRRDDAVWEQWDAIMLADAVIEQREEARRGGIGPC